MGFFRSGKLRWLYLLALAQLVGGPLVILQVTVFCSLTVREAPRTGVVKAATLAWNSHDFQVACSPEVVKPEDAQTPSSGGDPKVKAEKVKQPIVPWDHSRLRMVTVATHVKIADRARVWTPAWPQAPPGPPPRVG